MTAKAIRDELAAMVERLRIFERDLNSKAYEDSKHSVDAAWKARAWAKVEDAASAVERAVTAVEIGFEDEINADEPECSICRSRHPNDDRHPCE